MTTLVQEQKRILVVAEDEMLRTLFCLCLDELNSQISFASSSKIALQMLLNSPQSYDILITDNIMSELTGSELILKLKEKGHSLKRIILASSMIDQSPELLELVQIEPKVRLVKKPFLPNQILEYIIH